MKKILLTLAFLALIGLPATSFAADDLPAGSACQSDDECAGTLACLNHVCAVDSSLDGNPTGSTTNPGGGLTGTSTTNPGTGSTNNTDLGFVSLTKVPGLDTIGNSGSLSSFLNNIYKYCIGAAAVIAVIQLIRAGIQYMLEGGFMEKKEAKQLIGQTIAGLLLVLSPVIVFGIINPKILSLSIDTSQLQVTQTLPAGTVSTSTSSVILWSDTSSPRADAQARCTAQGGTAVFTCEPPGGQAYIVPITQACKAGEDGKTICKGDPNNAQECSAYTQKQASGTGICNGANGFTQISASCCSGLAPGAVCCGAK